MGCLHSGYLSFQRCFPGYYRDDSAGFPGRCVPCECNGHAEECEDRTGRCLVRRNSQLCFVLTFDLEGPRPCTVRHTVTFHFLSSNLCRLVYEALANGPVGGGGARRDPPGQGNTPDQDTRGRLSSLPRCLLRLGQLIL